MTHPQQEQCIAQINALARGREPDFRIAQKGANCYYFVSDHGAQVLKDGFGIESSPVGDHLKEVVGGFELGRTPHNIPRENLTAVVGRFGLSDALRGVASYLPKKAANIEGGISA